MTGRWNDLGPDDRALVEASFVALETTALIGTEASAGAMPSPSALWAHVTGVAVTPRTELAAALLRHPDLRVTLAGMVARVSIASGPRVAAAATGQRVRERSGDGFRLRLLPARGAPDQTWIMIALDTPNPAPTRLTVLPPDGVPETASLEAPVDGGVQLLAETASALVRALSDPTALVFLL